MGSPRKISHLERVLTVLQRISHGPRANASGLANELQVSRRTVFRDLDLLRKVGVAIRCDDPETGYELDSVNRWANSLSRDDVRELIVHARASVLPCSPSQRRRIDHVIRRLSRALPPEQQPLLEQIQKMSVEQDGGLTEREQVDTLVEAAVGKQAVTVHLVEGTGYSEPEIEVAPLRVEFRLGRWVLDAVRLSDHAKMRIVLGLIDYLEVSAEPITPPLSDCIGVWTEPDITITQRIKPSDN